MNSWDIFKQFNTELERSRLHELIGLINIIQTKNILNISSCFCFLFSYCATTDSGFGLSIFCNKNAISVVVFNTNYLSCLVLILKPEQ